MPCSRRINIWNHKANFFDKVAPAVPYQEVWALRVKLAELGDYPPSLAHYGLNLQEDNLPRAAFFPCLQPPLAASSLGLSMDSLGELL